MDDPLRPARQELLAQKMSLGEDIQYDDTVVLLPENVDAATVYMQCRRQVISVGMDSIVDISIPAVKTVMDLNGVEDQRRCLLRVQRVFDYFENKRRQDNGHGPDRH